VLQKVANILKKKEEAEAPPLEENQYPYLEINAIIDT
jgi:hypothetical protein